MIYGIFSKLHANLEALEAVLGRMDELGVQFRVFLGNAVGYGPDPNDCLDRIREVADVAVLGGADWQLSIRDYELGPFYYRQTLRWTGAVITPRNFAFLEGFPDSATHLGIHFQHSAPIGVPRDFHYLQSIEDAREAFLRYRGELAFYGNSGKPQASLEEKNGKIHYLGNAVELERLPGRRILVDVGAVGQPRDRDPRACFFTYDSDTGEIRQHRVAYDIDKTAEKMKALAFPEFLRTRLYEGR